MKPGRAGPALLTFASLASLLVLFVASPAWADGAAAAVRPIADGMEVRAGDTMWRITAVREDIVRVRIGPKGRLPEDASWAVLPQARQHSASVQSLADANSAGFRTGALTVRLDLATQRLTIADAAGHVLSEDAAIRPLTLDAHGFSLRKTLPPDEHYFGLGDKAGPLDRRGQAFAMWNTDAFGWGEASDPLYKSIPFFIGVDGEGRSYGLLLDNTWRTWFDFGRTDRCALTLGAEDGPLDYYVIAGPAPKQVTQAYAWLTGPSPMPPLWALGFQQSRYSYMSDKEVRDVAARLRAEKIPADALYLDIDYQDRNRPFTVNTQTFPDLARLAGDLKGEGFHLVAITDLHIADAPGQGYAPYNSGAAGDHFVKAADGKPYVGEVWPGPAMFPDFTQGSTRAWWGGLYGDFHADGIAGFWNDMNEPAVFVTPSHTMPLDVVHRIDEPGFAARTATHAEIHNIFGMENSRATYEGLLRLAPDERPFVLTRASFAGGQRYAATWTGDNDSTWNHLEESIPQLQNLGLSGFAWSGADVGGYAGSPSPELLTRWIEVAAFTPLFRDHSGKGTARHEPWVDGPAQTAIRRRFIEERYRLMPYLYALADETARTGVPLMRPLFLEFPATVTMQHDLGAEFLLGPGLLVAPPPRGESLDAWDVTLPGWGWFDYWTGRPVVSRAKGSDIQIVHETPALDRLPVFVRPGTILPRQPLVQSTMQKPDGPLELRVYPGPDCHGALYWDDGVSRRREAGAILRQAIGCQVAGQGLTVTFDKREGAYAPWWTSVDLAIYGWARANPAVRLGSLTLKSSFDAAAGVLHIALPDQPGPAVVTIE